jgi:hypothetical protein
MCLQDGKFGGNQRANQRREHGGQVGPLAPCGHIPILNIDQ